MRGRMKIIAILKAIDYIENCSIGTYNPLLPIAKTVGHKCKKTNDQTDTIAIIKNERKDLAF